MGKGERLLKKKFLRKYGVLEVAQAFQPVHKEELCISFLSPHPSLSLCECSPEGRRGFLLSSIGGEQLCLMSRAEVEILIPWGTVFKHSI